MFKEHNVYKNLLVFFLLILILTACTQNKISEEEVQLKYGEEKILAVYRENKESILSGYDYQDDEIIKEVLRNNETVLFLKIEIEKAK